MSDILLDEQTVPVAPSAGQVVLYQDSSNNVFAQRSSTLFQGDANKAITAQIASHSANTYYLGMKLPNFSMQAGMTFIWTFFAVKTAGVATPIYTIKTGANQSTADTTRLTITGPAQTAVADTGYFQVMVTVRSVGAAGVIQGTAWLQHNLAATGFANTPAGLSITQATSAGFDNSALGGQYVGLAIDPGAAAAWVVEQCVMQMSY